MVYYFCRMLLGWDHRVNCTNADNNTLQENIHSGLAQNTWGQNSSTTHQSGRAIANHMRQKPLFTQTGRHIQGSGERERETP